MSKPFDMELFLTGVLTGSHATQQRHVRQAKIIQAEIAERWQREAQRLATAQRDTTSMDISTAQSIKLAIVSTTGLSKDALRARA